MRRRREEWARVPVLVLGELVRHVDLVAGHWLAFGGVERGEPEQLMHLLVVRRRLQQQLLLELLRALPLLLLLLALALPLLVALFLLALLCAERRWQN